MPKETGNEIKLPSLDELFSSQEERDAAVNNLTLEGSFNLPDNMMGDLAGSDKRYSFRTNVEGNDLHVFESPIDLLSYMTLMNIKTGRWLAEPILSLGGVYKPSSDPSKRRLPVALQNMLENHPEVTTVHLHLDNDTAGRAAACNIEDQLKNRYNVRLEFPPRGKDCNDYLMSMRKHQFS